MQRAIQLPVLFLVGALAGFLLPACGGPEPVTVFAAASLADALTEIETAWEADHPDRPVELSFAGSQTLARQIAAGAPADLYVAADRDRLLAAERLVYEEAVPLLGNRLVVIVPAGQTLAPIELADPARVPSLALGDPEAGVPAGVYARAWLEREGLWNRLAPRVVATSDVRAAVAAVASGAAAAGVVYRTDARGDERLAVAFEVSTARAPRIVYFAAPVVGGTESDGHPFLDFLTSAEAGEIFHRHGFEHLPAGLAGPPPEPSADQASPP